MDNNTVIAEAEEALERANAVYDAYRRALWDANTALADAYARAADARAVADAAFAAYAAYAARFATVAREAAYVDARASCDEGVDNTNLSGKV